MIHKSFKGESVHTLPSLVVDSFSKNQNNNIYHKKDVTVLKAFNGSISALFSESKTVEEKKYYWDDYNQIFFEFPYVELPEMKVQSSVFQKKMNDFDIRDELGGNHNLCFKGKTEALRVLGSSCIETYRHGNPTIVYYLNEEGKLCYVYSFFYDTEWPCFASKANDHCWDAGFCILHPMT